jgi:hypothetical protein
MRVYKTNDNEYAAKAAHKLLQTPQVIEVIEKERKKMEDKYEISRGMIIRELLELVDRCKAGDEDRQHLLKSLDILNKMAGNYVEKKEINVKGEGIIFNYVAPSKPSNDTEN